MPITPADEVQITPGGNPVCPRCGRWYGPGDRHACMEPADGEGEHRYLSTACLHGLHDRCRKVCKFCGQPCVCDECRHTTADEEPD